MVVVGGGYVFQAVQSRIYWGLFVFFGCCYDSPQYPHRPQIPLQLPYGYGEACFLRGTFFVCSISPPLCACPSERDSLHTLSPPRSKLLLLVPLPLLAYWWGEGGFRLKTGYFCCSASTSVLGKLCLWGGVVQPSSWSCPAPSVRFL